MKNVLVEKLARALDEVGSAEKALAEVLREIRSEPRAEKTWTISKAVEDAFERLKSAKTDFIELEKLATSEPPSDS